jgi:hypothetical protein
MHNLEKVTDAVRIAINNDPQRRGETTLSIIKTRDSSGGESYLRDDAGEYWRTFEFIQDTATYDVCPNGLVASEAAAILGRFQRDLLVVPPADLVDTIPHFHNGVKRFSDFEEALKSDAHRRAAQAREEVAFAQDRRELAGVLVGTLTRGEIPLRATHNDMKLNNVLFNREGKRAICLLDLDTCMAGTPLYDFGDLVRNTAVPCEEDERDLSKVVVDIELYRSIAQGYLAEARGFLTPKEVSLMPVAPRVLALTLGVRFLTDFLRGDVYFRTHRANQNLDRARTQFAVVRAMERVEAEMTEATGASMI